ncbi:adenosine receptor A1-like [Polymixia lowei]
MNATAGGCMASMPLGCQPRFKDPYIVAELLIALLSVTGNFLVCLAVTRNRKLRTVTNYFLVSLSVADILVGLLAVPCAVLTYLGRPRHNLPLCLLLLSILMVLTQSSVLSLVAVAVERYVAILLPFQYQRIMSPRNARLALLLTWILSLLSGSVPLMDWHKQPPDSDYCIFTCVVDMNYMVYFNFFGCFLVPLVVMFIFYGHIFITIRRQLRRIAVARGTAAEAGPENRRAVGSRDTGFGSVAEDSVGRGSAALESCPETSGNDAFEDAGRAGPGVVTGAGVDVGAGIGDGASSGSGDEAAAGVGVTHRAGAGAVGVATGVPAGVRSSNVTGDVAEAGVIRPAIQTNTTTVFRSKPGSRIGSTGSSSSSVDACPRPTGRVKSTIRTRQELRKATSLFLVLFLFMMCWMPIHCINCVVLLCPHCPVPLPLTLAAILLSHANSALNPLLYAYRMRSFRHTLKGICPKHH